MGRAQGKGKDSALQTGCRFRTEDLQVLKGREPRGPWTRNREKKAGKFKNILAEANDRGITGATFGGKTQGGKRWGGVVSKLKVGPVGGGGGGAKRGKQSDIEGGPMSGRRGKRLDNSISVSLNKGNNEGRGKGGEGTCV